MVLTLLTVLLAAVLTSAQLATLAAGVVAPFITNLTKNRFGIDSLAAYGLHLVVSAALAAGVLALTGELSVGSVAEKTSVVALLATSVFQLLKKASGLTHDITPPADEPGNE